jgi:hypothetical protein
MGDTATRPLPKLKKNSELEELIRGMSLAHLGQAPTAAPKRTTAFEGMSMRSPSSAFFLDRETVRESSK